MNNSLPTIEERPATAEAALATAEACVGAVHRLAWRGPDERGDRVRALAWFRSSVTTLSRANRALASVLDWWLVAAVGDDPVELAWSIDREIPGRLGEVLRAILESDGDRKLDVVRRPAALQEVLAQLEQVSERNPGKIAADKHILGDALSECRQVIRAAEASAPPPTGLRLPGCEDEDLEAWASEGTAARRVTPGTPVWDSLVRQLTQRRDLIRRAFALWPGNDREAPELPRDWRKVLQAACGDGGALACALVEDAVPEPGERPRLGPSAVLDAAESAPPQPARRLWFVLVREAVDAGGLSWPRWAAPLAKRLDALGERLDELHASYEGDAAEALAVARQAVADIDPDEAEVWVKQAAEMHQEATVGADLERLRARGESRTAELEALGEEVPSDRADVSAWVDGVDERWRQARQRLREDFEALRRRAALVRGAPPSQVAEAERAIQRSELLRARDALAEAGQRLTPLLERERERMAPELWAVLDGADDLDGKLRASIRAAAERAVARREVGLSAQGLVADLEAVVRLPSDAAAIGRDGRRLALVLGGLPVAGDLDGDGVGVAGLTVTAGVPEDAPARVARWGEVWTRPRGEGLARVFLRDAGTIEGPFTTEGDTLVPSDPRMATARVAASEFDRLFGRVAVDDERWLVPLPPSLDELLAIGAEAVDRLDDEAVARWLAAQIEGAPLPEILRRWIDDETARSLPDSLRDARLERLGALVGRAEALAAVREDALRGWLESEDGAASAARAAEALVDREAEAYQQRLAVRRAELDRELSEAETQLATVKERLESEERQARADLDEVKQELEATKELLGDHKLRLLAELGGLGGGPPGAPVGPAEPPATPIRASGFRPTEGLDMATLVREVAGHTWGEIEVANLLLSLATGRWTLMAGLPGVGKSTFVRSVLTRLGHGPGTERYLELVVRRDWQDDAALFGFWHPTQRRWTASSEGFVEHLLRAADGTGGDGLWPVLVEELNLASPEYYLARMLSAFEAAHPSVRLYDAELVPSNAGRYPPAFALAQAVRVLGTVNVDDTVERLSPRFLSRASVIWVEPRLDAPLWRPEDDVTDLAVPWSALEAAAGGEEAELGPIMELVRLLQDQRVPGAPTARTRRAIGRYLAASRGVMPATDAQDLQVLQRVLPPLRGVGPRWRKLLERMAELQQRHGWRRSAARTLELRERGEELGDWYDFFHT